MFYIDCHYYHPFTDCVRHGSSDFDLVCFRLHFPSTSNHNVLLFAYTETAPLLTVAHRSLLINMDLVRRLQSVSHTGYLKHKRHTRTVKLLLAWSACVTLGSITYLILIHMVKSNEVSPTEVYVHIQVKIHIKRVHYRWCTQGSRLCFMTC